MSSPVPPQQFGKIAEFSATDENIDTYLERVQLFFAANGIADDKQSAVLLTSIGAKAYDIIKNEFAPQLPGTKTFAEIAAVLKSHFAPKPSIIAERFYFHRRRQI